MSLTAHLKVLFEDAAAELHEVTPRRMFGCDAFFARKQIFGLIWKQGRIGVRLPDAEAYAEAMRMNGAAPWKAGPMVMSHWVLLSEELHDDPESLAVWARRAHQLALSAPPKPAKKKPAAKQPAAKRAKPVRR